MVRRQYSSGSTIAESMQQIERPEMPRVAHDRTERCVTQVDDGIVRHFDEHIARLLVTRRTQPIPPPERAVHVDEAPLSFTRDHRTQIQQNTANDSFDHEMDRSSLTQ